MDTCINYCEPGWAYMSSDEKRWINHMHKLADEHPDECIILKQPEQNSGFIYAKFPPKWAKIAPPRTVHLSEERKIELSERLKALRREKNTDE